MMLFDADAIKIDERICTVEKDPKKSGLEDMKDALEKRYAKKHMALIEQLSEIGLPAPGEQYRLVTRRSFNSIQFIDYIAQREGIEHLTTAIYSINFQAAKILLALIDAGKIDRVDCLMSNLRNAAHREKEVIIKNLFTEHPKIDLFFCSSHAKAMACKTRAGNYYAIEGSGNMAYNSRVEQYVIDNDEAIYRFSLKWMADIKKYLTITT
jgi:hypothetical protein